MSKIVEIELEVESGLTENAVETLYRQMFPDDLKSLQVTDTEDVDTPINGEILAYDFVDNEHVIFEVMKNNTLHRETYKFVAAEEA